MQVAARCRGHHVLAVNDAYLLFPYADILYACDTAWWKLHRGAPDFVGERWSTTDSGKNNKGDNPWNLRLLKGEYLEGFSRDPTTLSYGRNSGFQAVNLAMLLGCTTIVLVGFDMHHAYGAHFFGDHPIELTRNTDHSVFTRNFKAAARSIPPGVQIINATPGSGLTVFPMRTLDEALGPRP